MLGWVFRRVRERVVVVVESAVFRIQIGQGGGLARTSIFMILPELQNFKHLVL